MSDSFLIARTASFAIGLMALVRFHQVDVDVDVNPHSPCAGLGGVPEVVLEVALTRSDAVNDNLTDIE